MKQLYLFLLLVMILLSCQKEDWKLKEINFLQLKITDIDSISITSLKISGEIKDLKVGEIEDHGFVWTDRDEIPNIVIHEKASFGILASGEESSFDSVIVQLVPRTRYTFAVFAKTKDKLLYSDTIHYTTGTGRITTDSLRYIPGTTKINLYGTFSGAEAGIIAVQHGFCWSTANVFPSLSDAHENIGNLRVNQPFIFTFDRLVKDTPFYFRAYAIFQYSGSSVSLDTVYANTFHFANTLDVWIKRADFYGFPRKYAVGFSINNKGYIGTGFADTGHKRDFWEYDPEKNQWTQKADFGGIARYQAVGFSIKNKGYIGFGRGRVGNGFGNYKDFWEYDPIANKWTQKADLPGDERSGAVGFSIEDKGYVGTGENNNDELKKDFWEYDPIVNKWTQKEDFEGKPRSLAAGFSIGNRGYIGTGHILLKDFWEYDPFLDKWTQKADFEGGTRSRAIGFSIHNKGYIGFGEETSYQKDLWEYNPILNKWIQKANFPFGVRNGAIGFSIKSRGYFGTGIDGDSNLRNDFWEY